MRDKRGAINWTIGKLINIVLLTVVMALIIYGLTTGGLNPLIKNVEGRFDEVLIMLNIKDDVSFDECFFSDVDELGGGEVFLRKVGLEGENIRMNVCRNRMCNFTGELKGYRYNEGVFEALGSDGEWINDIVVGFGDTESVEDLHTELNKWSYAGLTLGEVESRPVVGFGDAESTKLNWKIYREVSSFLESAEGLDFLANPRMTKKFVLTGDAGNDVRFVVATWQNNVWKIERNVFLDEPIGNLQFKVFTEDDALAIDVFARSASVSGDDEVSYDDGMGDSGEIGELVGDEGWFGSDDELDDDREIEKLKSEFSKKKDIYLDSVKLNEEDIANLTRAVDGKNIFVDGVKFEMTVDARWVDISFHIFVNSGDKKFLVEYMLKGEYDELFGCARNSLPIVLYAWHDDSTGRGFVKVDESYYKLDEECFSEFYRKKLVYDFLGNKCR